MSWYLLESHCNCLPPLTHQHRPRIEPRLPQEGISLPSHPQIHPVAQHHATPLIILGTDRVREKILRVTTSRTL